MYADSSKNSEVRQERRARPCRAPGTSSKAPWGRVQNPLVPPAEDGELDATECRAGGITGRECLECCATGE